MVARTRFGARRALSGGTHVPRPGRIHVEVLPPIGGRNETPQQLRDATRALILARLGEPDLARERECAARVDLLAPVA